MRVVHHNKQAGIHNNDDLLLRAGEHEKNNELDDAANLYLRYLKKVPGNENAYSRLMIIYRKQKEAKKELAIINQAIKTFEDIFKKEVRVAPTRKTIEISKKLIRSLGLADKKGKELNEREPLRKWKRRKMLLEKRLRKKRTA